MTKTESNHGDASQDDTTRNEDIEMVEQPENQDNNCATSEAVDFQDNSVEGEKNESSNKSDQILYLPLRKKHNKSGQKYHINAGNTISLDFHFAKKAQKSYGTIANISKRELDTWDLT